MSRLKKNTQQILGDFKCKAQQKSAKMSTKVLEQKLFIDFLMKYLMHALYTCSLFKKCLF